ncbi:hypothetical protein K437DRAFT_255620 [Tilletiaria anomala UBC 951]|uniref:Peptide hydrolase n=1 Tax=Tilletiaria anomala (strain ATCC 24038 / CBS 436.72 / UBC 951) TaxID=1037660 RepID=A0A066W2J5_TILAU|nr:uncharacterized protein K437DRAFT_255620 [Tilletiaria anomala UBC 951]KDN48197.1 hypothetical protein K437DRAFT_255620 [Tilletiaria anomala UBC 951]
MPPRKSARMATGTSSSGISTNTKPATKPATKPGAAPTSNGSLADSSALYKTTPKSPLLLVALAAFYICIASLTLWSHYSLPTPISLAESRTSEQAGEGALFSEENALRIISKLSDEIGYRVVGTAEHVQAEDWFEAELRKFEGWHPIELDVSAAGSRNASMPQNSAENIKESFATNRTARGRGQGVEVEVWKQIGDGAHRFDFMSSVVWKKYYGMSNLIVRISDGTDEGKQDALLLNAHIDSTLPSPGAADDGAGVAVLYELLRIFTTPPLGKLHHSIVLLFNNGEESLQDASHLYITQHHTNSSVRAVVNLEACGVSGPELLFQATSESMIKAYSTVPRPFGTVLANDIFSTGLILSDTDFRQFVQYGGLAGLDMAIVGGSYLYHTRLDISTNIERGVVQHFGENVLAIVKHLVTSPASTLAKTRTAARGTLPIYFSLASRFFVSISSHSFRTLSMGLAAFTNFQLQSLNRMEKHFGMLSCTFVAFAATIGSIVSAIVTCNAVALLMANVLGRSMSWYAREWFPVLLYGPPALTAILTTQWLCAKMIKPANRPYMERATLSGHALVFVFGLLIMNAFSIGSAYLMALGILTSAVAAFVNDMFFIGFQQLEERRVAVDNRVHHWTYFIIAVIPACVGTEGLVSFLDLFVPLTGRMGEVSPADNIIGTIVAALTFLCLPMSMPLAHRFGSAALKKTIVVLLGVSVLSISIFATRSPFDKWHPKRLFVHQSQNITSGEWFMNLGSADPAPGMRRLVDDVHTLLGLPSEPAQLKEMSEYNVDFDILYPVSAFLTPYKFRMETPVLSGAEQHPNFRVQAFDEVLDLQAGTRSLTLQIDHPGLIWSVVAFDADILEWDLPSDPPKGRQRHHIKEVSRHGTSQWTIKLLLRMDDAALEAARKRGNDKSAFGKVIKVAPGHGDQAASAERDPSRLWIDFSGLDERGMFPSNRDRQSANIANFARMDAALQEHHPEVDAMLLTVVAGVAVC